MNHVLILFTHPRFEKSRVNRALLSNVEQIHGVTLHDLYEQYPDFNVDIEREKALLIAHRIIIWHHPFYMYGAPALLKHWIDLVLEYGWAHGAGGGAGKDKLIFNAITTGGAREGYGANGFHRFTIGEFLLPFHQTAAMCRMIYLPPFAVQGTHRLTPHELSVHAGLYRRLLLHLTHGEFSVETLKNFEFLNDWLIQETEAPAA